VRVVEQPDQNVAVEYIDPHRGEEEFLSPSMFNRPYHSRGNTSVPGLPDPWFFYEARNVPRFVNLQDAQRRHFTSQHRNRGDGDVGLRVQVAREQRAVVHAIKLVPAQNDAVIEIVVQQMNQILAVPRPQCLDTRRCSRRSASAARISTKPPPK